MMTKPNVAESPLTARAPIIDAQSPIRQRIIQAATDLLAQKGRDAVTTRAVAAAAGVQAPAIYRFFGDKDGLLAAVAEHSYTAFLAAKHRDHHPEDPIADLRAGWDLAVEFGISHPGVYALINTDLERGASRAAFEAGMQILKGRIQRLAAAGRLRVGDRLAATLVHATARGAVLTWLALPEDRRDPALLTTMRESMVTAITNERPAVDDAGYAGAARTLRARLPEQTTLSRREQDLLAEWLDRLAADG